MWFHFFVYFMLLKLVFHVFNIVSTQGNSFQCEDVSLTFIDGHYTMKHFNRLEYVERLFFTTNDGLWVLTSNEVCNSAWSNNVGDIFCLGFRRRVHSWLGYQKGVSNWDWTTKDNFGFCFILHYYKCSGLLYANR